MADDFFERFQAAVEGPAPDEAAEETGAAEGEAAPKKGWFKRMMGN